MSKHHHRLCHPGHADSQTVALLTRHYRRVRTLHGHFGVVSAAVGAIFQYSAARFLVGHLHRSDRHQRAHNLAQTLDSDLDIAAMEPLSTS